VALDGGDAVKSTGLAGAFARARKKAFPDRYNAKKDKEANPLGAELATYINDNISGGGGGDVSSVFGRTGAVVAESGDYDSDQVDEGVSNLYMTTGERSKLAGIEDGADVTDATNVAAAGAQMTDEKGVANGYASLDATGKVPTGQLPAVLAPVDSVNGQIGVVVLDSDDISEGATNKYYPSADASKLAGIESGAQVNAWQPASNLDIDTGAEVVDSFDPGGDGCVVWHYFVSGSLGKRGGSIGCAWDYTAGTAVSWQSQSQDIGDTSDVVLSADMDGPSGNVQLVATVASDDWIVRVLRSVTI
jgi:hypothetical protein